MTSIKATLGAALDFPSISKVKRLWHEAFFDIEKYEADHAGLALRASTRFARGNVAMRQGSVFTEDDWLRECDELGEAIRKSRRS